MIGLNLAIFKRDLASMRPDFAVVLREAFRTKKRYALCLIQFFDAGEILPRASDLPCRRAPLSPGSRISIDNGPRFDSALIANKSGMEFGQFQDRLRKIEAA